MLCLVYFSVLSCSKNSPVLIHFTELASPAQKVGTVAPGVYKMVFDDEFNGTALDLTKWNYRALGKRRAAYNVKSAVSLDGRGHLVIQTKILPDRIETGMIGTQNLFESKYGYYESRIQFQHSIGQWGAFWLNTANIHIDYSTPEKDGTEIDIVEHVKLVGANLMDHDIHWGGYGAGHHESGAKMVTVPNLENAFHTYAVEWTPTYYRFFVDNVETWRYNGGISKQPEYMILSLEVQASAGAIDPSAYPDKMVVDYVRVYQK